MRQISNLNSKEFTVNSTPNQALLVKNNLNTISNKPNQIVQLSKINTSE